MLFVLNLQFYKINILSLMCHFVIFLTNVPFHILVRRINYLYINNVLCSVIQNFTVDSTKK